MNPDTMQTPGGKPRPVQAERTRSVWPRRGTPAVIGGLAALFLIFFFVGTALAQSSVMSVKGQATWKSSSNGQWQTLAPGKLPEGAIIKTGPSGFVRLIHPDGQITVVRGNSERRVGNQPQVKQSTSGSGFFGVLRAMLFSSKNRRKAALESTVTGLEAEEDPQAKTDWLKLLESPPFKPDDIEKVLETVSGYSERPYQNRGLALMERMRTDLPSHPGVQEMVNNAKASFGAPAIFTINKVGGTLPGPLRNGSTVVQGDRIRLNYQSETESFPYIFLLSVGTKGAQDPALLYPKNPTKVSAVEPRQELFLPGPGHNFRLNDNVGQEFIWVWSCAAPVKDMSKLLTSMKTITATLKTSKEPSQALLNKTSPGICPQAFSFVLNHR